MAEGVNTAIIERLEKVVQSLQENSVKMGQLLAVHIEILARKEKFDIVLLFGVLYHLPNPIMILQKLFENTDMLLIASHIIDSEELAMYYYPEGSLTTGDTTNWWVPTPSCLTDIGTRIGVEKSVLVDTFDFDSINANLQQDDKVKSGLRRIHKMGLFKMEGRNEVWKSTEAQ